MFLSGQYPPYFGSPYDRFDFKFELRSYTSQAISKEMTDEMEQTAKTDKEFYYMCLHKFEKLLINNTAETSVSVGDFLSRLDIQIPDNVLYLEKSAVLKFRDFENEEDFTKNFLVDFFKKVGYQDVRYTHGVKEYGKDVVMRKQDERGNRRYIGVQAKHGDVSGSTSNQTSNIDTILKQIEDGFSMSIPDFDSKESVHMSEFIVVISGNFSDNATQKILKKLTNPSVKNNVYFIDQVKIRNTLSKFR